jgi:hypothetical protein
MKFAFVLGLAGEEVITILVEGSSTNPFCSDEGRGKDWEAEVTEEGELVGGRLLSNPWSVCWWERL